MKNWILNECDKTEIKSAAERYGVSGAAAAVALSRKIDLDEETEITSPFNIADMARAAREILSAADGGEHITIYGDYDCDGITATVLLYTYLLSIGANADYYIPSREGDGYGLNSAAVDALCERGTELIITVDNGISAINEAEYIAEKGIKLVVTDHHAVGEKLPKALAAVDPDRSDDTSRMGILSGVGVAFKLVAAMECNGDEDNYIDGCMSALENYSDLLSIGTIGDIVPLTGENRALVRHGLERLPYSENIGLRALFKAAGIDVSKGITAREVAFAIVPRINAAGRMNNAEAAARLLLSEDEEEADALAAQLNEMNAERRKTETDIQNQIEKEISRDSSVINRRILVMKGENWHFGVLGIVCSRLVQRYNRPVFLMSECDGELRGSARSCGDFNIFDSMNFCKDSLIRYGGHKKAGGFSLKPDKFDEFNNSMQTYAKKSGAIKDTLILEKQLEITDLTLASAESLSRLEPYGAENEQPLFLLKDTQFIGSRSVSNGKHQRFRLKMAGTEISVLCFGISDEQLLFKSGDMLDLAVSLEINEYNNQKSVTIKAKDIRPSAVNQERFFAARECFFNLISGEKTDERQLAAALPTRDEFAAVYKKIKQTGGFCGGAEELYFTDLNINFCKLSVILTALEQLKLIKTSYDRISLCPSDKKVSLWSAPVFDRFGDLVKRD